jgi:hypothetical protein
VVALGLARIEGLGDREHRGLEAEALRRLGP